MAEAARELGYDPAASPLRIFLSGGEPGGSIPSTRKLLLETWGLTTVCDAGTSSEIVRPDDPHSSAAEGETGNIVYTHLWRISQPMIRFASNDRSFLTSEPCPCGRT